MRRLTLGGAHYNVSVRILISAGEASGEMYGAELITALRQRHPSLEFFGVGGERMRTAGCDTVIDAKDLAVRSEEHTSELQSRRDLVCRLLLEKKKNIY